MVGNKQLSPDGKICLKMVLKFFAALLLTLPVLAQSPRAFEQ